jgi:hypothetical protein
MLFSASQVYEHVCEETAAMDSAVRQNAKLVQALRDRLASAVHMSITDGTALQAPAAGSLEDVMQSKPVYPMCRPLMFHSAFRTYTTFTSCPVYMCVLSCLSLMFICPRTRISKVVVAMDDVCEGTPDFFSHAPVTYVSEERFKMRLPALASVLQDDCTLTG